MRDLKQIALIVLLLAAFQSPEATAQDADADCYARVDEALTVCAAACQTDACISRCDKASDEKYAVCERKENNSQNSGTDDSRGVNDGGTSDPSAPARARSLGKTPQAPARDDKALPDLGPVPEWSTRASMDAAVRAAFVKSLGKIAPSLGDVGDHIAAVFRETGYSDYGFYRVDGGFAIVARLEKIKADGTPDPNGRHYDPTDSQPFGFAGFIAQLIYGPEGFYRVIVLIVSDQPVIAEGGPPTVASAEAWFVRAADRLPPEYAALPFTSEHAVTAIIYEFEKGGSPDKSAVVPTRRLSSEQHLRGAGFYDRLGFGARP